MSTAVARLVALADPERAAGMAAFFKTGPGGYGEGDQFLGLTVPQVTAVAREHLGLPVAAVEELLEDDRHEVRLLALKIMAIECAAKRTSSERRRELLDLYLRRTDRVNNWDLVDVSSKPIVGGHLQHRDRTPLYALARSELVWDRRIAIVGCQWFLRAGDTGDLFVLAALLLDDRHDLMHKAVGWSLREAGKRDPSSSPNAITSIANGIRLPSRWSAATHSMPSMTPSRARITGRLRSRGALRKCSSMAWPPASSSSKRSKPTASAIGRPIADHKE